MKLTDKVDNEVIISKVARELGFNRALVKAIIKHRDTKTNVLIRSRVYKEIDWKFFGKIVLHAKLRGTPYDKLKKMIEAKRLREQKKENKE